MAGVMGLGCRSGSNAVRPDSDGSPRGSDANSDAQGIDAEPGFAYQIRYEVEAPRALGITFSDAVTATVRRIAWRRRLG